MPPNDRRTVAAEMWAKGHTLREIAAVLRVSNPTVVWYLKGRPPRGCLTCGGPRPSPRSRYCAAACRPSSCPRPRQASASGGPPT